MNSQLYLFEITRYLAWFTSEVKIENQNGNTDINKYAEGLFIPILKPVFKKEFERLEYITQNYPAIDLGTKDFCISFQITSEKGFGKVQSTIEKFINNKLYEKYAALYHLVIDESYVPSKTNEEVNKLISSTAAANSTITDIPKFEFDIKSNVWNISTLRKKIEKECSVDELKEIRDYLKSQYGDLTTVHLSKIILLPYQIAFKIQLAVENQNLPHQFHTPFFGRENDLRKIDAFITNASSSILAVIADGGYGKTRTCIEYYKRYLEANDNYNFFVLNPSAYQSGDFSLQNDSNKRTIVLFDDAHKNPKILPDLITKINSFTNVKLVLTVRKAVFSETLKVLPTHDRAIDTLELSRLTYDETQSLFKTQLPGYPSIEILRISEQSKGIPTVILSLCQITQKGKYQSDLSEEQNFILFVNEIKNQAIEDIHKKYFIDKININKVIELISFFAPIKNNEEEITAVALLNDMHYEETCQIIEFLEEYNFITSNQEISIEPDPYSDTIFLESSSRIKHLLKKDIEIFTDRFIRKIAEVDSSERFGVSIDAILLEFISTFKNASLSSTEEIKFIDNKLNALRSFTYKKPRISFVALKYLFQALDSETEFWNNTTQYYHNKAIFEQIHSSIETILATIALNSDNRDYFDEFYTLALYYANKKSKPDVLTSVFSYRVYDFKEYGYYAPNQFVRFQLLIEKMFDQAKSGGLQEIDHKNLSKLAHILLLDKFDGESHFNKHTNAFSFGKVNVPYNKLTSELRLKVTQFLMQIYLSNRYTESAGNYLEELIGALFYIIKPRVNTYNYNQSKEVVEVIAFLKQILNDSPSIYERSRIIRQLTLFERREVKDEYVGVKVELLNSAKQVNQPKEKLNLLYLSETLIRNNEIDSEFTSILGLYPNETTFFEDLIQIKNENSGDSIYNFNRIILFIAETYPELAKNLLNYVIEKRPEFSRDFCTLIKANYTDETYFYDIIAKIWALQIPFNKSSVLWMLAHGRNGDSNYYREIDLDYIENAVETTHPSELYSLSIALHNYVLIDPKRTINLISKILKDGNESIVENLLSTLFDNKVVLSKHSDLIKEFMFNCTMHIDLDSNYFHKAFKFLDNKYGFDILFNHLVKKIQLKVTQNVYYTIQSHYSNHEKSELNREDDFVKVLLWQTTVETSLRYSYKKLVNFLKPSKSVSESLKLKIKTAIDGIKGEPQKIIYLCSLLEIFGKENENNVWVSLLIETGNELCKNGTVSQNDLRLLFGESFIGNNGGVKTKSGNGPYPQDLQRKALLESIIENTTCHPQVLAVLNEALKNTIIDINEEEEDQDPAIW